MIDEEFTDLFAVDYASKTVTAFKQDYLNGGIKLMQGCCSRESGETAADDGDAARLLLVQTTFP